MDVYVGFDSAWTDNPSAPGAICAIAMENDRCVDFRAPRLISFKQALAFIREIRAEDGLTLIAVVASRNVLSEAALKELMQLRLELQISPEQVLAEKPYSWKVSKGCDNVTLGNFIERAVGVWQVPEPFKDKLLDVGGPFAGLIIAHKKTAEQPTP